jgi:hypothetical protein
MGIIIDNVRVVGILYRCEGKVEGIKVEGLKCKV